MTFASQLADCCATVSVFSNADYVNVVISGTSSLSWFVEYLIWAHLRPFALKYVHTVVMIARAATIGLACCMPRSIMTAARVFVFTDVTAQHGATVAVTQCLSVTRKGTPGWGQSVAIACLHRCGVPFGHVYVGCKLHPCQFPLLAPSIVLAFPCG